MGVPWNQIFTTEFRFPRLLLRASRNLRKYGCSFNAPCLKLSRASSCFRRTSLGEIAFPVLSSQLYFTYVTDYEDSFNLGGTKFRVPVELRLSLGRKIKPKFPAWSFPRKVTSFSCFPVLTFLRVFSAKDTDISPVFFRFRWRWCRNLQKGKHEVGSRDSFFYK